MRYSLTDRNRVQLDILGDFENRSDAVAEGIRRHLETAGLESFDLGVLDPVALARDPAASWQRAAEAAGESAANGDMALSDAFEKLSSIIHYYL